MPSSELLDALQRRSVRTTDKHKASDVGRSAGWTAHCCEQMVQDRLIRPQSEYTGTDDRRWTFIVVERRVGGAMEAKSEYTGTDGRRWTPVEDR